MGKHPRWTPVRKFICWSCGTVTRPLVVKFKRAVHARERGPVTALDWIAPLTLGCMPRTFSRGWNLSSPVSFCSYFWWIHRYCRWSHKPTYNWGKLGPPSRSSFLAENSSIVQPGFLGRLPWQDGTPLHLWSNGPIGIFHRPVGGSSYRTVPSLAPNSPPWQIDFLNDKWNIEIPGFYVLTV